MVLSSMPRRAVLEMAISTTSTQPYSVHPVYLSFILPPTSLA